MAGKVSKNDRYINHCYLKSVCRHHFGSSELKIIIFDSASRNEGADDVHKPFYGHVCHVCSEMYC